MLVQALSSWSTSAVSESDSRSESLSSPSSPLSSSASGPDSCSYLTAFDLAFRASAGRVRARLATALLIGLAALFLTPMMLVVEDLLEQSKKG